MQIKEVFAHLVLKDAPKTIEFYKQAFGAVEKFRLVVPGTGRIGHAEVEIGGVIVMLAAEYPELGLESPLTVGKSTTSIHLHVDDCDAAIERALAAGGTLDMAPQDQFYGERTGVVRDPSGHRWSIGHQLESLTPEAMQKKWDAMTA
jgi:uncharacterized glyoxalase superfamily protein PhnB